MFVEHRFFKRSMSVAALSLVAVALSAPAQATTKVNTSHWRCRFCPFPSGPTGQVTVGIGAVSANSPKFGEYSDLDQNGPFLGLDADLTYYGKDAAWWNLTARNLGLEDRSVEVTGGTQGKYKVDLGYDEIVHHESAGEDTPFQGTGTAGLTLPSNWQRANTTQGMTALRQDLHSVDIGTKRQRFWVGIKVPNVSHWNYSLDFHQEHRTGTKITGAAFLNTTSLLPEPVNYDTNRVDAGVGYHTDVWQLNLGYMGSFFQDKWQDFYWSNPFTAITPGSDTGQMSTPPDNQFHQIHLSGIYRFSRRASFAGNMAWGRMTQDQNFGSVTTNAQLSPVSLPRNSADAKVDTFNANGRLVVNPPIQRLSLVWSFRVDQRHNKTPSDAFQQVVADSYLGSTVTNHPLSYDRYTTGLRADYDLHSGRRLSAGMDYEKYKRDFGDNPNTNEYTGWAQFRTPVTSMASLNLKASHSKRTGSNQSPNSPDFAANNPLLTWYDIADRIRNKYHGAIDITPRNWVTLSLIGERTLDNYGDTQIGRTRMRQDSYTLDVSFTPADKTSVYTYATQEDYKTEQANSQTFSTPDWTGKTHDRFYTVGVGGKMNGIKDKLDLSADLSYSHSRGTTDVTTATPTPPLPAYRVARFRAQVKGDYKWSDRLGLGMTMIYEHYLSRNWQYDGVSPDTVAQMLSLGTQSPDYHVVVGLLTVTYKLGAASPD